MIEMKNLTDFITFITTREATEVFVSEKDNHNYRQDNYTRDTKYEALVTIGGQQHVLSHHMRYDLPEHFTLLSDMTAEYRLSSKAEFVKSLMELGVSTDKLKVLKSAKASELKEVFDNSPAEKDGSFEEIAIRFTKKGDSHVFNVPKWKKVKISVGTNSYNNGLSYIISIDMVQLVKRTKAKAEKALKTTGLPIFEGTVTR